MAEPKCPACNVEGIEHIVSKDSKEFSKKGEPWFQVVHCNSCGHVYGIFSKHVIGKNAPPLFTLPKKE